MQLFEYTVQLRGFLGRDAEVLLYSREAKPFCCFYEPQVLRPRQKGTR